MLKKIHARQDTLSRCLAVEAPGKFQPPNSAHFPVDIEGHLESRPALKALYCVLKQLVPQQLSLQLPVPAVVIVSLCLQPLQEGTKPSVALVSGEPVQRTERILADLINKLTEAVCIEVIDRKTTIKDSEKGKRLTGQMNCKIRLMNKMGFKYVFVDGSKEIDEETMKVSLIEALDVLIARQKLEL